MSESSNPFEHVHGNNRSKVWLIIVLLTGLVLYAGFLLTGFMFEPEQAVVSSSSSSASNSSSTNSSSANPGSTFKAVTRNTWPTVAGLHPLTRSQLREIEARPQFAHLLPSLYPDEAHPPIFHDTDAMTMQKNGSTSSIFEAGKENRIYGFRAYFRQGADGREIMNFKRDDCLLPETGNRHENILYMAALMVRNDELSRWRENVMLRTGGLRMWDHKNLSVVLQLASIGEITQVIRTWKPEDELKDQTPKEILQLPKGVGFNEAVVHEGIILQQGLLIEVRLYYKPGTQLDPHQFLSMRHEKVKNQGAVHLMYFEDFGPMLRHEAYSDTGEIGVAKLRLFVEDFYPDDRGEDRLTVEVGVKDSDANPALLRFTGQTRTMMSAYSTYSAGREEVLVIDPEDSLGLNATRKQVNRTASTLGYVLNRLNYNELSLEERDTYVQQLYSIDPEHLWLPASVKEGMKQRSDDRLILIPHHLVKLNKMFSFYHTEEKAKKISYLGEPWVIQRSSKIPPRPDFLKLYILRSQSDPLPE